MTRLITTNYFTLYSMSFSCSIQFLLCKKLRGENQRNLSDLVLLFKHRHFTSDLLPYQIVNIYQHFSSIMYMQNKILKQGKWTYICLLHCKSISSRWIFNYFNQWNETTRLVIWDNSSRHKNTYEISSSQAFEVNKWQEMYQLWGAGPMTAAAAVQPMWYVTAVFLAVTPVTTVTM